MSIIQDALKRQQAEDAPTDENPLSNMPLPEDAPSASPEQSSDGNNKPWVSVLVVLIVLLAAVTGVYLIYKSGVISSLKDKITAKHSAVPRIEPTASSAKNTPPKSQVGKLVSQVQDTIDSANKNVADSEQAVAAAKSQNNIVTEKQSNTDAESKPVVKLTPEQTGSEADKAQVEQSVEGGQKSAPEVDPEPKVEPKPVPKAPEPAVAEPAPKEPAPEPVREPVIWPQVSIKGIMAPGSGNRGAVLLDSSMFSEGDTYKGIQILQISRSSVLLEFKGEKRSLSTGQSIGN